MGHFTGLQVSHEPGQWGVWSGVVLIGVGLAFVFYVVHTRFWVVPVSQPNTGMTLIVLVGLAMAFLLFMAFLNVVKSGNLLNETNLLFATLIFYSGAGALYLGFGVTGTESYVKFASLATWLGLIANT